MSDALSLYIHWPFCASKCPYCDFNSHVRAAVDEARWRAALLRELDHFAARTGRRRVVSLFFGGGTPGLMAPKTVAALIDRARMQFVMAPDAEITLEVNPGSVESDKFAAFRDAGVNRLSIGVQSLDDDALRFLGRGHDAAQAIAAAERAAALFPRWSIDLIYGLPGETPDQAAATARSALALAGDHISLYQLTIEPGTVFAGAVRRGEFVPLSEQNGADAYERVLETLEAAGFPAYEVSNAARPGGASRHNLQYWRYGDYIGVGPGAHGRLTLDGEKRAFRQHRAPEIWLERVEAGGAATQTDAPLSREERLHETLVMGLRLSEGVPLARIEAESGQAWDSALDAGFIAMAAEEGLLTPQADRLIATPRGRLVLDSLLPRLSGC